MFTLGAQYKGPELKGSSVFNAINLAMSIAAKVRDPNYKSGEDAWINAIYLVPGSVSQPKFDGYDIGHFSKKEKGLLAYARQTAGSIYHASCTAAMGKVVDSSLKVLGVDRLRVVDASIMPSVVSGNTNAAVIAIAEKAAHMIRADRRTQR